MNIEFDRSIKVQTTDDPPLSPAATPAPGPDPTLDGVTVCSTSMSCSNPCLIDLAAKAVVFQPAHANSGFRSLLFNK
eukprot:2278228-Prymnesium_polylepis.1